MKSIMLTPRKIALLLKVSAKKYMYINDFLEANKDSETEVELLQETDDFDDVALMIEAYLEENLEDEDADELRELKAEFEAVPEMTEETDETDEAPTEENEEAPEDAPKEEDDGN